MAAPTKQRMVTAIFRDQVNAQNAYAWLLDHGYSASEVNVLMSERTRKAHFAAGDVPPIAKSHATEGAAIGGAIGTAVGASLAALASLTIPGLGLVIAGPIVAALAGGGAGAVTGGAIGGLVGLGISESNAKAYENALKEGGIVLGLVPHSDDDHSLIVTFFEKAGGEHVCFC